MKYGKRLLIGTLLTISLVNMASPAAAYEYMGWYWHQGYAGYCLDSSIPSGWSTPIAQAANTWNNAGADFYFYTVSCNNKLYYQPFDTTYCAFTYPYADGDEATGDEIFFNSNLAWSTSGASNRYDVRNVATHEFGHWLALYDLDSIFDIQKTMYYAISPGETKKQSLHSDDIAGICYIYP